MPDPTDVASSSPAKNKDCARGAIRQSLRLGSVGVGMSTMRASVQPAHATAMRAPHPAATVMVHDMRVLFPQPPQPSGVTRAMRTPPASAKEVLEHMEVRPHSMFDLNATSWLQSLPLCAPADDIVHPAPAPQPAPQPVGQTPPQRPPRRDPPLEWKLLLGSQQPVPPAYEVPPAPPPSPQSARIAAAGRLRRIPGGRFSLPRMSTATSSSIEV